MDIVNKLVRISLVEDAKDVVNYKINDFYDFLSVF